MNREKVIFAFFIILALTLNFGFVFGEIADPEHHSPWELFAAIVVNLIATVLKFGDRTHIGSVLLATSLVADLQLIAAAAVWGYAVNASAAGYNVEAVVTVVSLASGALVANIISVVLLTAETLMVRR
jgi:hypothetical protein